MTEKVSGAPLPVSVDAAMRDLINALSKTAMYPPGHRFIVDSTAALVDRLNSALTERDSLPFNILPASLLFDGTRVTPLSGLLREFAVRMHRRNIAVIEVHRGITQSEIEALLAALSSANAEDEVGRAGLRSDHLRVEPMSYDALTFGGSAEDQEIDAEFWAALAEAATGGSGEGRGAIPTVAQLVDAISGRAAGGTEDASIYTALSTFAASLAGRSTPAGRARFAELLSALSRPTTARVVDAAGSSAARRRFLADSLELLPPALLLQLVEVVADADGMILSPSMRKLMGKLVSTAPDANAKPDARFALQVLALIRHWDGASELPDDLPDTRVGIPPATVLRLGLELSISAPSVINAAERMADSGKLGEALALLDEPANDPGTVRAVSAALFDPSLLVALLKADPIDFALVDRVAANTGTTSAGPLLDALAAADDRSTRRRILDSLVRIGPDAEAPLLARLPGAPWYLARNILAVLAQFPAINDVDPIFRALEEPEVQVRQEALKVLIRHRSTRDRAIAVGLASSEQALMRLALTALGSNCPPQLVASVMTVVDNPDQEIQTLAIRALSNSTSTLVVPKLLPLVATHRGLFRRLRLQPKSPVMLAAIEALAGPWSKDSAVAAALSLAQRSGDSEIQSAAKARA